MTHTKTIDVTPSSAIVCTDGEVLPTPTKVLAAIARDSQIPLQIIKGNEKLQKAAQQVFWMDNQEALSKLQQIVNNLGSLAASQRRDAHAIDQAIAPIARSIAAIAQQVATNSQSIRQLDDRVAALENNLPTAREAYLMGQVTGMQDALRLQGQPNIAINNTNTNQQSNTRNMPRLRFEGYDAELPISYYVQPDPEAGKEQEVAMLRPIPAEDVKAYTALYGSLDQMLQSRINERAGYGTQKASFTRGGVMTAIVLALFLSIFVGVLQD